MFYRIFNFFLSLLLFFFLSSEIFAKSLPGLDLKEQTKNGDFKKDAPLELQADQVSFSNADNKASAKGNVVLKSGKQQLFCDELQLDRNQQVGVAQGKVFLDSPAQQVDADGMTYNFNEQTGEFRNARMFVDPYQIKGQKVSKVSENHMAMDEGYMTTCDHDKPHFRMGARRMDIYPGDKMVARGVKIYLGRVPIMYLPRFTQDLKNEPLFTFIPGYKKDFGAFLLTQMHLRLNPNVKITLHGDYRERTGVASGFDVKYNTPHYGSGIVRTYYMLESEIPTKHPWQVRDANGERVGPTVRHERFKAEWRHAWQIDRNTNAIWQYYKIHDYDLANMGFMKRYFEREFRRDPNADNYFLFTRVLPHGTLTYRIDASRVNRVIRGVERLPEIQYDANNQEIGSSGFYLKSTNAFSNLIKKDSALSTSQKTMRLDTNNEVSYPMKIAFVEMRPFVGGEHTYYSRTNDLSKRDKIRGVFRTGSDLSTKFYRIWNYKTNFMGLDLNGLRHVVTPTVAYIYQHNPTRSSTSLNQFDGIDAVDRIHKIGLGLENKWQTKRKGQTVDLLRTLVSSDFALKENPSRGGFGNVRSDIEFHPNEWLTLNGDTDYNHYNNRFETANFDAYFHPTDRWSFDIGKRFAYSEDDQITTEFRYKINPKWSFKVYERFSIDHGGVKEEQYSVTRDLHEWKMDFSYRQERGIGAEFFVIFRLKAFPDMDLDLLSTAFHQRKAGSQSTL